jgi:transcriptional regulator with XRE-family HTH domain
MTELRNARTSIGSLMREWRQRRGLSQLALSAQSGVSQRHLSFVESGRAMPSRELVLALSRSLSVPFRERNELLLAAGFAPIYRERPLESPALAPARAAVERVLKAYEPFPALAIDRHWSIVMSNAAVTALLSRVHPDLLRPPVNALRVSLHPLGLAPQIVNLPAWRAHVLERLEGQVRSSGDPELARLLDELRALGAPSDAREHTLPRSPAVDRSEATALAGVAVPLELDSDRGRLSFLSTTTVFGTPLDITLAELAIEAFLPADPSTADALRSLAST